MSEPTLNPEALRDLYLACQRIVDEDNYGQGDITIGAIEDCQAAIQKAENR